MIVLTTNEVISIHDKLVKTTGGSPGLRDTGLLDLSVMSCLQTFGGEDIYPTVIEKAARIAYSICKNHPFVDGNKRVAVTALLVTLCMNDITIKFTQDELITLGLSLADGSITYDDTVSWVNSHIV